MKTLWIGCSHSCGYYEKGEEFLVDKRISMVGLPVEVSRNWTWEDFKIISAPGAGVLEFAIMLSDMDNRDILNFDNVILQLTNEPRLVSWNAYGELLKLEYMRRYLHCDNNDRKSPIYRYDSDYTHPKEFKLAFNAHPISLWTLLEGSVGSQKDKNKLLDVTETMGNSLNASLRPLVEIAFQKILSIIKKRNINLYTFHWYSSDGTYKHLPNTKDYLKYDIFDGQGIWDISSENQKSKMFLNETKHPTNIGVARGSVMIIEALKKNGFQG